MIEPGNSRTKPEQASRRVLDGIPGAAQRIEQVIDRAEMESEIGAKLLWSNVSRTMGNRFEDQ